jgi:hypothetical protein
VLPGRGGNGPLVGPGLGGSGPLAGPGLGGNGPLVLPGRGGNGLLTVRGGNGPLTGPSGRISMGAPLTINPDGGRASPGGAGGAGGGMPGPRRSCGAPQRGQRSPTSGRPQFQQRMISRFLASCVQPYFPPTPVSRDADNISPLTSVSANSSGTIPLRFNAGKQHRSTPNVRRTRTELL